MHKYILITDKVYIIICVCVCVYAYVYIVLHRVRKRCNYIFAANFANVDQFSKFFHWQT